MKKVFVQAMLDLKNQQIRPIGILLALLLITSSIFSQITVKIQNQSIRQILKTIEAQSDYRFFYNDNLSSLGNVTSLSVNNASIESAMDQLLANTDIVYREDKDNLIVLTLKAKESKQQGDIRTVTGQVIDEYGDPVIGANIMIKGTTTGSITDLDGNFSIQASSSSIIEVTYIGYLSREIPVGNNTTLSIELKEDLQRLDEVVVVGYGVQKKV